MLPVVDPLFTLVRQLAARTPVTDVAAPKWLVVRHGLAGMAANAGATSYRNELALATLAWARIEQDVPAVVGALRAAGIRVAAIKGLAYAKTLYAHPAERPMGDVDLLVPVADRSRARSVLAEVGFTRAPASVLHHAEAWTRGDLALDLHWNIIAPGRSRIDLEGLWGRTQPGWPDGAEQLEPIDALVFHLVHLARNRLRLPLMNVVDTARLCERADADAALARARAWGLGSASALALRFCRSIIAGDQRRPAGRIGPTLDDVAQLRSGTIAEKIAFDVATAGSPTQLASRVVHFAANKLRRISSR